MHPSSRASIDPITAAAAGIAAAGIVWLGPLMVDQFVLFADRDQAADAAAARAVMPYPAVLVALGAALLAARRRLVQGAVAALPLVAVLLAWTTPEALYQLLAYGVAAPAAIGALLAATIPLHGRAGSPWTLVAIGIVGVVAIAGTPFLAGVIALAAVAWWAMSRHAQDRPEAGQGASALD
jgi:hypothetical protein